MRVILKFECIKILKNRSVIGSMLISLLIMFGIFYIGYYQSQSIGANRRTSGNPINLEQKIQEQYTGEFSDERISMIVDDYMELFQEENQTQSQWQRSFYPFYWYLANSFFPDNPDVYLIMNETTEGNFLTTKDIQIKTVQELGFPNFEKPVLLGDYVPWKDLYTVTSYLFMMIALVSILVCSLVFAEDVSKNINQLLLTTHFGRTKMIVSKLSVGLLIPTSFFVFVHAINYLFFI